MATGWPFSPPVLPLPLTEEGDGESALPGPHQDVIVLASHEMYKDTKVLLALTRAASQHLGKYQQIEGLAVPFNGQVNTWDFPSDDFPNVKIRSEADFISVERGVEPFGINDEVVVASQLLVVVREILYPPHKLSIGVSVEELLFIRPH